MKVLMTLTVVSGLVGVARADDDMARYLCHAPAPGTQMSASFQPETSLQDLAIWVMGFTCKNVIFSADVAKHATRITVLSPNKMTPKQAVQLFVDAVEAAGLVVTQKADTIIIKLGPGMPKGCPDVASAMPARPTLPSTTSPTPRPVLTDPPPPAPDEPAITDAELDAGIKAVDATHRTLSRALLDRIVINPMAMAKGARVVPSVTHGKADGFKLYAIRPTSLFARLGFLNGDRLISINKLPLTSADQALDAYAQIRDAKQIECQLDRRGAPVTLVITVTP